MLHRLPVRKILASSCHLAARAVIICLAFVTEPVHADRPVSSLLDYIDSYPEYPAIDYGSGAQAEAIRRGEYLARVGDCIACHTDTKTGSQAFAGGLPIPTPFGTFFTPNITPDKETGLGDWTEENFITVMHEGILPDGSNAFPAFPYVFFNRVSTEDLKDIWAYLQVIPPVIQPDRGNTLPFPLNLRFAQYGWKLLFFYPGRKDSITDPDKSDVWNRGAYLVEGLGHCSMCHTPMNLLGAQKNRFYLTGAFIDGYWAPDITKQGLETASRYQVTEVFSEGRLINQAGAVRGPMADAIHDSLRYLKADDRLAIAEYLKTVESKQPRHLPARLKSQPRMKRGEQVYANVCILCHLHGEAGAPGLRDRANWERRVNNNELAMLYRNALDGFNNMPARGACVSCSDEDVFAAVDFMLRRALEISQWKELTNRAPKRREVATNAATGKQVYKTACSSCHDSGREGAPVTGDLAQWAPLLQKNFDELLENALHGIKHMPARDQCVRCSGSEIIAAVKYMAQQSQTRKDYSLW